MYHQYLTFIFTCVFVTGNYAVYAVFYSNSTHNITEYSFRAEEKESHKEKSPEELEYLNHYPVGWNEDDARNTYRQMKLKKKYKNKKSKKSEDEDPGTSSAEYVQKGKARRPGDTTRALDTRRLDRPASASGDDDADDTALAVRRRAGDGVRWSGLERGLSKSCSIKLKRDFGEPSPVYLLNGQLLEVKERGGLVRIRRQDNLTVACPGKGRLLVFDANIFKDNVARVHCLSKNKFRIGRYWRGKFKHIECNTNVRPSILKSREKCGLPPHNTNTHVYRVGFHIAKEFHQLYHGCFDKSLGTTLYIQHKISPKTKHRQRGGRKPYYTREKETFDSIRIANAYHIPLQRRQINFLLGRDTLGKYINEHHFLARAQLAPRLDFIMRTEQRAAYTYLNTVPQWKHIKSGDWARLEDGLRLKAQEINSTLRVWTGTYGIWTATAPGRDHKDHQMYLMRHYERGVTKHIVPVPMYLYKVVYLRCEERATAFISVNMPPKTDKYELESKVFCKDICKNNRKFHWLKWKHHNSLSFCCTYEEFSKMIPTSIFPLEVNDVFY